MLGRIQYILIFLILFIGISCSNELQVLAPYEETTVIYGILDPAQTTQYIKVNKAFINPESSALEIAAISDSMYHYDSIEVSLTEFINSSAKGTYIFEPVLTSKEDGLFFQDAPNQLIYKSPNGFIPKENALYSLKVMNSETGDTLVTSITPVVNKFSLTRPTTRFSLTLASTEQYRSVPIEWTSSKNSRLYEIMILFTYQIRDIGTQVIEDSVTLTLVYNDDIRTIGTGGGESMRYDADGERFFKFLNSQIDALPPEGKQFYVRKKSLKIQVAAASDELSNYIEISKPSVFLNEVKPDYTNIDGGLGIFASKQNVIQSYEMSSLTLEKLLTDEHTAHLKFAVEK